MGYPTLSCLYKGGEYMNKIEQYLLENYTELIKDLGYSIYHIEYKKNHNEATLRVYIEPIEQIENIDINACETVSRSLSSLLDLDANFPVKEAYVLEVSSPGIERELYTYAHYLRYLNDKIRVRVYKNIEKKKEFVGILAEVTEEGITLSIETKDIFLTFKDISKAQLHCDF